LPIIKKESIVLLWIQMTQQFAWRIFQLPREFINGSQKLGGVRNLLKISAPRPLVKIY